MAVRPTMTQDELTQFIKTVFYTYDRILVPKEVKEYAAAWGPYLEEFDYKIALQILPNICMGKEFPPRPWEIRVGLINNANQITQPPPSQQAWAQYQEIMIANNTGAFVQVEVHDVLRDLMRSLGSVSLNNQFDAKRFETLYEDKVKQWFKNTYWVQ